MTNAEIQLLASKLLHANREEEVVSILSEAGLWASSACWRLIGDDENNFKVIGAQQARPEPAIVEKLINSVDARLMAACLLAGINPESEHAPQSIEVAKKQFFNNETLTALAKAITLAVTGARSKEPNMPSITICDNGEGQTPKNIPSTFMSIDAKNKLRIPFVQGKFNMGGTGALMFCGRLKLQLLITRRNSELLSQAGETGPEDALWAVTVVRRETPPEGPGQVRNPYFKYLAPVDCEFQPGRGEVLSFVADELNLMPKGRDPYERPMVSGSCIKLYEYDMRGFKGHALRTGGLLSRLEVLLPEIALPVRVHECRSGFRGHDGSFDTNLLGLRERLESSRGDNLEPGYPASLTLSVQGQPMLARIYLFREEQAERYRADQGVVFAINGQTHGWFPKSFFERSNVKMGRLKKSLLIVIDCTNFSVDARADLFKNSRDRLSGGDLRRDIEEELESQIANHQGLREARERRRQEEVAEKLSDAKPLEDVLREIFKTSPSLSKMFLMGQRLSSPFRLGENGAAGTGGSGSEKGKGDYMGRKHPTFFRFDKLRDGETLRRTCELSRRCRIHFSTDVENEYFVRDDYRGRYHVEVVEGPLEGRELTTSVNLFNGVANWSVAIPGEDVEVGDELTLQFSVDDDVMLDSIINIAHVTITQRSKRNGGSGERRENSRGKLAGETGLGSNDGNKGKNPEGSLLGVQLPPIHKVRREGWPERSFNECSACTVIEDSVGGSDSEQSAYSFYVNVDNIYLKTDMKQSNLDPALIEAKFVYGNVLVGLALIHEREYSRQANSHSEEEEDDRPLAELIEQVTKALGPFLIPMIEYLGGLEHEQVTQLASVGDEE